MTSAEFEAIARQLIPPSDGMGGIARAYIGETGGDWRLYFGRDLGRVPEWVGPRFTLDRAGGRASRRLCALVNGERSSRPEPPSSEAERHSAPPVGYPLAAGGAPSPSPVRLPSEGTDSSRGLPPTRAVLATAPKDVRPSGASGSPMSSPRKAARPAPLELGL